jgi:hypothetical protein
VADYDRLARLKRGLGQDGIDPVWCGGPTLPWDPRCQAGCRHYERLRPLRCGHTGDTITDHCRPAVQALVLSIVHGAAAPSAPESIARQLSDRFGPSVLDEIAQLLSARAAEVCQQKDTVRDKVDEAIRRVNQQSRCPGCAVEPCICDLVDEGRTS